LKHPGLCPRFKNIITVIIIIIIIIIIILTLGKYQGYVKIRYKIENGVTGSEQKQNCRATKLKRAE